MCVDVRGKTPRLSLHHRICAFSTWSFFRSFLATRERSGAAAWGFTPQVRLLMPSGYFAGTFGLGSRGRRFASLRFASRFSLFRCVKTRFVATNVFFSVWWGRWWSRGRGGGGLGGSRAPDADPLEKNKGGRRQKNVQNRSRNAEKRQNASCRLCSHQRLTRTVPRTRLRPCAERSLRARSVRPSC